MKNKKLPKNKNGKIEITTMIDHNTFMFPLDDFNLLDAAYRSMKEEITTFKKENPVCSDFKLEGKIEDEYGSESFKCYLHYTRPLNEKELNEIKNEEDKELAEYKRLKAKFEK